jgi:hypothetical protein
MSDASKTPAEQEGTNGSVMEIAGTDVDGLGAEQVRVPIEAPCPLSASHGASIRRSFGWAGRGAALPHLVPRPHALGGGGSGWRRQVSHSCACNGSPCLRHCVHGASIGGSIRVAMAGERAA